MAACKNTTNQGWVERRAIITAVFVLLILIIGKVIWNMIKLLSVSVANEESQKKTDWAAISGSSQENRNYLKYFKRREFNTRNDAGGGRKEKPKQKTGKPSREEK